MGSIEAAPGTDEWDAAEHPPPPPTTLCLQLNALPATITTPGFAGVCRPSTTPPFAGGRTAQVPQGVRVVIVRTGIVLARDGGVLAKMLPIFELFAGGPLGTGK